MTFEKTTALLETNEANELELEERVMLDSIYYHMKDMTSSQIVSYFSENPIDAKQVKDYIKKAIDSDYPKQRAVFLEHLSKIYL
jgi:hypothetical protein